MNEAWLNLARPANPVPVNTAARQNTAQVNTASPVNTASSNRASPRNVAQVNTASPVNLTRRQSRVPRKIARPKSTPLSAAPVKSKSQSRHPRAQRSVRVHPPGQ